MADRSGPQAQGAEATNPDRLTPAAFAARFEGAWQTLWYIAAAVVGDRAGVDDVLQEAAVIALGKLSQFDPHSNFVAWMGKIVRFTALNHARRRMKTHAASMDPQSMESMAASSNNHHRAVLTSHGQMIEGQEEFDDQVKAALASLDETARACLLLRTVMNMPYKDISQALDLAEGTAMSHVHRARIALREKLASMVSSKLPGSAAREDHAHG